jgi:hypothetical protein
MKVAAIAGRPNTYRVESESRPHVLYTVQIARCQGDLRAVCNCLAARNVHGCKHEWRIRKMAEAAEVQTETTTAIVVAPQGGENLPAELAPIEVVQRIAAVFPTRDEIAVMNSLAATVVLARGHAVPAAIDSPQKAFAVMLAGWELGIRPMTAFRHMFVLNGKVELDGQAMMGVVMARDPSARFVFHTYTSECVEATISRATIEPITVRYTLEDAKTADLLAKGPWKTFGRDMLTWACVKRLCRLGAPNLINAIDGLGTGMADAYYEPGATLNDAPPPEPDPDDPRWKGGKVLIAAIQAGRLKHSVEGAEITEFLGQNNMGAVKRWLAARPKASVDDLMLAIVADRNTKRLAIEAAAAAERDADPIDGESRDISSDSQPVT